MRIELKEFQTNAVHGIIDSLEKMRATYEAVGDCSSVCLASPTGSGKTVMCASIIESLFFGNDELGYLPDEHATVLWVSDSPDLNEQTLARFIAASDKLADWVGDRRHLETVTNDFCASHEMLERHHVYFLNKQLLSRSGQLVRGDAAQERQGVLGRARPHHQGPRAQPLPVHRRGALRAWLQRVERPRRGDLYANLIDGFEGRAPAPIVVGVSATPKRFEDAMNVPGRVHIHRPIVEVLPRDVQESGLLKDTIELRVPEKDDAVDHQYLTMACQRFAEACRGWSAYCSEQKEGDVFPLMIVQVKDGISNSEIAELCDQITKNVPGLNRANSFANVFGEHRDLACGHYLVTYVKPENVQDTKRVRVLFAKEAVSNGWDCPRAEVIFSQRRRSEPTYIAQLVGRMVRTPLARRIDADEMLNSVACYLPQFNPEATQKVVDYLTGKTDDMGGTGVQNVFIAPVVVQPAMPRTQEDYERELAAWKAAEAAREEARKQAAGYQPELDETPVGGQRAMDLGDAADGDVTPAGSDGSDTQTGSAAETAGEPTQEIPPVEQPSAQPATDDIFKLVPMAPPKPLTKRDQSFSPEEWRGIREAWDTILVRRNPKKPRNEFKSLLDTATLLVDTGLDKGAARAVNERFAQRLAGSIVANDAEFASAKHEIEVAETQRIIIDKRHGNTVSSEHEEDVTDDEGIAKAARDADVAFGGKELPKAYMRKRVVKDGAEVRDAQLELASVVRTKEIMDELSAWAAKTREAYFDDHAADYAFLRERDQQRYDELERESSGKRLVPLAWPDKLNLDGTCERYPKHIVQDEDGLCPLKLKPFEVYVLNTELARERTVAFYRNPGNYSPQVFSIPYMAPNGRQALHPDFIFFVRGENGDIRPSIIDPHGTHLADVVPKLKGYVEYIREFPDTFVQVLSVGTLTGSDEYRMLDLKREDVQQAIMDFDGDYGEDLYRGHLSSLYGHSGEIVTD